MCENAQIGKHLRKKLGHPKGEEDRGGRIHNVVSWGDGEEKKRDREGDPQGEIAATTTRKIKIREKNGPARKGIESCSQKIKLRHKVRH